MCVRVCVCTRACVCVCVHARVCLSVKRLHWQGKAPHNVLQTYVPRLCAVREDGGLVLMQRHVGKLQHTQPMVFNLLTPQRDKGPSRAQERERDGEGEMEGDGGKEREGEREREMGRERERERHTHTETHRRRGAVCGEEAKNDMEKLQTQNFTEETRKRQPRHTHTHTHTHTRTHAPLLALTMARNSDSMFSLRSDARMRTYRFMEKRWRKT